MGKYRVINSFKDLEDNNHVYIKNVDIYPREGLEPTKKRIKELTSTKNKIGKVLIEEIEDEELENNEEVNSEELEKSEENNEEVNSEELEKSEENNEEVNSEEIKE